MDGVRVRLHMLHLLGDMVECRRWHELVISNIVLRVMVALVAVWEERMVRMVHSRSLSLGRWVDGGAEKKKAFAQKFTQKSPEITVKFHSLFFTLSVNFEVQFSLSK